MTNTAPVSPAPRQTVYRRKRTKDFTVLGNAVLFDRRLDLDEGMALVKLLAKPHDWQIKPSHLQVEWNVGREKFYRIIRKLIRLGYITRGEMIKDHWGRYTSCEYIITDEPEAPPEESTEALPDDGFDDETSDRPASESGGGDTDATPVASVPQSGFPHTAGPHTANQHGEKELRIIQTKPPIPPAPSEPPAPDGGGNDPASSQTPRSVDPPQGSIADARPSNIAAFPEPRGRGLAMVPRGPVGAATAPSSGWDGTSVPTFEQFVAAYKPDRDMSEAAASRRWTRLAEAQKIGALKYLPDVMSERAKRGWKRPDMRRYLLDLLWEGFEKAAAERGALAIAKKGTPQWCRWMEYYDAIGKPTGFSRTQPSITTRGEWPPPLPPKGQRANEPTQKPDNGDDHGT